ncbi:hypothetical protein LOC54_02445 [Acetobacter sp. AN02]|uniref:hypothetical protein n=1 Tax=Acetobacter sp. AN02 TaxID=2894186 RepID=UPI0024346129|nr:hypothetical protein [Acetobacter sp. AN02]MDG6093982.1 hypothetical protein [Acetobacter sp. AN02]
MARVVKNPYSQSSSSKLSVPELTNADLSTLANDPDTFFESPANRAKFFGVSGDVLRRRLTDYGIKNGIDNAAMIKTIITVIDI